MQRWIMAVVLGTTLAACAGGEPPPVGQSGPLPTPQVRGDGKPESPEQVKGKGGPSRIWMPNESGGVVMIVTSILYQAEMDGGTMIIDGIVENTAHDSLPMSNAAFKLVDPAGKEYPPKVISLSSLAGSQNVLRGERHTFSGTFPNLGPDPAGMILHYTPLPDAQPIQVLTDAAEPRADSPLATIDLDKLLISDGDFPAGFTPTLADKSTDTKYAELTGLGMPRPVILRTMSIKSGSGPDGVVTLHLFATPSDGQPLYNQVGLYPEAETVAEVGEQAAYYEGPDYRSGTPTREFSFTRCSAVVRFQQTAEPGETGISKEELIAYARRLDERLKPVVCP